MIAVRATEVTLRTVHASDLDAFYLDEIDPEANRMAVARPRDRAAFQAHWTRTLVDPTVNERAILADGVLVGRITCFQQEGRATIGYWITRAHWGRGIASQALARFLEVIPTRPLHARVAVSNVASIRVLERSGFVLTGVEMSVETERFPACDEALMVLM